MSSTSRGAEREADDNYPTPAWCVDRLLEVWNPGGGRWLEPAAGDGAIIRAVNARRHDVEWDAVEIRELCCEPLKGLVGEGRITIDDFIRPGCWYREAPDVIITNPPYSRAQEFAEKSLSLARHTAMLLRINYLASETRNAFMRCHTPDVYLLPHRPSFVKGKTDSCEYAWLVWGPTAQTSGTVRILATTPLDVRKAATRMQEVNGIARAAAQAATP
jgi:hypothetical protein